LGFLAHRYSIPIPGPWWAEILASIGILALFGMKIRGVRTKPEAGKAA
jgi:hypothetical protein